MSGHFGNNSNPHHVHYTNGADSTTVPCVVQIFIRPDRRRLSILDFRINFQPPCRSFLIARVTLRANWSKAF
jgi:hypothetical protein